MTTERAYVRTPRGTFHILTSGAGNDEALLLLHATPRSSRSYRRMVPILGEHFRVIAPDALGFGNSDPWTGPMTMEEVAASYVGLLDALGIERAHVFGLHTGNKVSAAFASRFKPRIGKHVFVGQTHSIIPDQAARNDAIRDIVAKYFVDYPASADGSQHLRRWASDHAETTAFWWPRGTLARPTITEEAIDDIRARVADYLDCRNSIRLSYGANFAFDLASALRESDTPTLAIELRMPNEAHLGYQLDPVLAITPRAKGLAIDNIDGMILEQRPAELSKIVIEFLKG